MGADLIISYFCVKDKTDMKKAQKNMFKAVDKLKPTKLFEKQIAEFLDYNNIYEKIPFTKLKEMMKEIIKETFDSLGYRDVSSIYHKGETIFITGGMSWGDDPTETFRTFDKFCSLPPSVLRAGGIR